MLGPATIRGRVDTSGGPVPGKLLASALLYCNKIHLLFTWSFLFGALEAQAWAGGAAVFPQGRRQTQHVTMCALRNEKKKNLSRLPQAVWLPNESPSSKLEKSSELTCLNHQPKGAFEVTGFKAWPHLVFLRNSILCVTYLFWSWGERSQLMRWLRGSGG